MYKNVPAGIFNPFRNEKSFFASRNNEAVTSQQSRFRVFSWIPTCSNRVMTVTFFDETIDLGK